MQLPWRNIVVRRLDLKSDLQITSTSFFKCEVSHLCLSFTICKMRLREFLLISSKECYWDGIRERILSVCFKVTYFVTIHTEEFREKPKETISAPANDLHSLSCHLSSA